MKRIVFLTIATLLVLGLVLAGCNGNGVETVIKIAVVGPMTDLQGQNHWDGASMAAEEINDAGGIDVGGIMYDVELVKVETKESTEGETGDTGKANLNAVIDDVDFCVGGFRTECVSVYRDVAMDAQKIFMNSGAATGSLQFTTVTNYPDYKYWFKSTPYNETFLVKSLLKMTGTIGAVLGGTLAGYDAAVKAEYKVGAPQTVPLRVVILMENAAWCTGMVAAAQYYLPLMGYNVTHTILVDPTATTIGVANWNTIINDYPHIIFTAFSGSVGAVYSIERVANGVPAVTIGINVPGQQLSHWVNTGGDCEGEIMLDTWGVGMNNTPLTGAWFDAFVARTGRYPVYTAATYDSIKAVCKGIDETNSVNSDVLIAWLENPDNAYTEGTGTTVTAYYQMPAIEITPGELYALNETQVREFYDIDSYGYTYNVNDWGCGFVTGVQQPHIAHDTVYGPGYQTGIGSQWQAPTGPGVKVGIWPMVVGSPILDQYGDWNFAYPGAEDLALMIEGMLNIAWDPYA